MIRWLCFCFKHKYTCSFSTKLREFENCRHLPGNSSFYTSSSTRCTQWEPTIIPQMTKNITDISSISQVNFPSNDISIPELLTRLSAKTKNSSFEEILQGGELTLCNEKLGEFNNEQIVELLTLLAEHFKEKKKLLRKSVLIRSMLYKLDKECCKRFRSESLKSVLPILNTYCHLKTSSNFVFDVFKRVNAKIHCQPLSELVNFVAIISRCDLWKEFYFNSYELEFYLERNFNNLDLGDILPLLEAISLMKRPMINSYELKKKLLLYLIEQLHTMNNWHIQKFLTYFCRLQKFTTNMQPLTPQFSRLVDTMDERFDEFSLDCISRLCYLMTGFLFSKPEFLHKTYIRFLKEADTTKISSVDYIIRSLTFFNLHFMNENAFSNILKILQTEPFKSSHIFSKRYIKLLSWICNAGVYDYNIINEVLDENFLRKMFKNLKAIAMYPYPFVLDMSIEIECPDYRGNRLNENLRNDSASKFYDWELVPARRPKVCYTTHYQFDDCLELPYYQTVQELPYYKILQDTSRAFNSIFGNDEFTHLCYILPHMPRPNLLFGMDANKCPQNITHLKNMPWVDWKRLNSTIKWNVITVLIRNTFLNYEAMPMAEEIAKIRQFKKLGFNVFSIVQDEWLSMNDAQKRVFCNNIIS